MNKKSLKYQQLIVIISLGAIIYYSCLYYYPWIVTLIKGSFQESHFIKPNDRFDLIREETGFYRRFFWKTLQFISSTLLLMAIYKYFKLLQLFKRDDLIIALLITLFDSGNYFISFGRTIFIGSTLYTFGEIFKRAYLNKQENDLTI